MGRNLPDAPFGHLPYGGDGWRIVAEGAAIGLARTPSVFAIGNGHIGVRLPCGEAPCVYLNGVYERVPIAYHEAAHGYARTSDTRLPVADATRPRITIDGAPIGAPIAVELDMARGVRIERFADGLALETLAAMARPGILAWRLCAPAALRGRIAAEALALVPPDGTRAGSALYDPRIAPEISASPWRAEVVIAEEGFVARQDRLARSGFAVAVCARAANAGLEGGVTIEGAASYAAARDGDPLATARAALAAAPDFATLAQEQAAWFADHWQGAAIAFLDLPAAEPVLRHAMFQLVQAVGRDGARSIAAKGQTGEGYEGHVFWDADLYVLPMFAFTRPEIARAMLEWRISGLAPARDNARAMGHARGALFPWRTIGGHECSSFFPAGSAQYHINADIAWALETYVAASGDRTILAEGGADMLVETARIWLEIGFHDAARGFVINRVTGPDEYSAIVDNNLYTNMMAARHLRFAATEGAAAGLVDRDEAAAMTAAAEAMRMPFDAERQIFAQDDAFFDRAQWPFDTTPADRYPLLLHFHPLTLYRQQVCKQADAVLALALMPERFAPEMRRRMIETYERVTVHDSTLSASAFATAAARAGDSVRALQYWRVAALTDLGDLFGNADHGLHMAALAGAWTAIAMGFAGMQVRGDDLAFDPIAMPGLGRYSFTIAFRGRRIAIEIDARAARYRLVLGETLRITHCGESFELANEPLVRVIGG